MAASAGGKPKAAWSNTSICRKKAPYSGLASKSSTSSHRVTGALETMSSAVVPARRKAVTLHIPPPILQLAAWMEEVLVLSCVVVGVAGGLCAAMFISTDRTSVLPLPSGMMAAPLDVRLVLAQRVLTCVST